MLCLEWGLVHLSLPFLTQRQMTQRSIVHSSNRAAGNALRSPLYVCGFEPALAAVESILMGPVGLQKLQELQKPLGVGAGEQPAPQMP